MIIENSTFNSTFAHQKLHMSYQEREREREEEGEDMSRGPYIVQTAILKIAEFWLSQSLQTIIQTT